MQTHTLPAYLSWPRLPLPSPPKNSKACQSVPVNGVNLSKQFRGLSCSCESMGWQPRVSCQTPGSENVSSQHPIKIPKWNHGITQLGQTTKKYQLGNILWALRSNCDCKSVCHSDWKCLHFWLQVYDLTSWSVGGSLGSFDSLVWKSHRKTWVQPCFCFDWVWFSDWMLVGSCSTANPHRALGMGSINQKLGPVLFCFFLLNLWTLCQLHVPTMKPDLLTLIA